MAAPLTGLPIEDPIVLERPAIVVKVDNHPAARPQVGIEDADVVIEERVESGLTRFFAIFQSKLPNAVGPVRSARTQDALIVGMLHYPLFAWSGGNLLVRDAIRHAPLVDVSAGNGKVADSWYRDKTRVVPHNLFVKPAGLYRGTGEKSSVPNPLFAYRTKGEPPQGRAVAGAKLTLFSTQVEWDWDTNTRLWSRLQNGSPHRTRDGGVITAANVVVLEVHYPTSEADPRSPEAQTVGTGNVFVLSAGRVVEGTWTRGKGAEPWTLLDADGDPIELTPGNTWVELVGRGRTALVGVFEDPGSVGFPPP